MSNADYRALLQRVAGVTSSTELTQAGFALVMDEFARLGFISTARHEAAMQENRASWAASYAQRSKIAAMWDKWKGKHDPDGLRRWLEHHHGVSDLRFVSAEKARKVIGALSSFKVKPETN
ncbi:MAG: regulatory protein GemA [Gallionella sp.]|nr:regulatory protein GemA [Gallionella sp.]